MQKSYLSGVTIAFGAFVLSCATTKSTVAFRSEPFSGPADTIAYFYRMPSINGGAAVYPVNVDGIEVVKLLQGAYWVVHLKPGHHKIELGAGVGWLGLGTFELEAMPGEVHYFKLDGSLGDKVTSNVAQPEIAGMKLDRGN